MLPNKPFKFVIRQIKTNIWIYIFDSMVNEFFILPMLASLELEQFNLNRWQRKAVIPVRFVPVNADHSFIFLFFSVILQLNPRVLPNLKANYKLIAAKFPYFPNSHWVSRARQCRATHAPRHAHQSSALTVTFSIFCVIPPQKSAQKIVQFKAICIWNYIHKLPHKDFFYQWQK